MPSWLPGLFSSPVLFPFPEMNLASSRLQGLPACQTHLPFTFLGRRDLCSREGAQEPRHPESGFTASVKPGKEKAHVVNSCASNTRSPARAKVLSKLHFRPLCFPGGVFTTPPHPQPEGPPCKLCCLPDADAPGKLLTQENPQSTGRCS